MVNKEIAIIVQNHSLSAIRELNSILVEVTGKCSEEDFNTIKRGVGLSLGRIQMELLEYVNQQYPEMDDLL